MRRMWISSTCPRGKNRLAWRRLRGGSTDGTGLGRAISTRSTKICGSILLSSWSTSMIRSSRMLKISLFWRLSKVYPKRRCRSSLTRTRKKGLPTRRSWERRGQMSTTSKHWRNRRSESSSTPWDLQMFGTSSRTPRRNSFRMFSEQKPVLRNVMRMEESRRSKRR